MQMQTQPVKDDQQLLFLPSVFNETLGLLFDAHRYFNANGAHDQSCRGPEGFVRYTSEMTRITLRLTSVMAWVMVRRAIHAGRIEEDKAASDYRLDGADVCMLHHPELLNDLPSYVKFLAERSHALYARVLRLDEQAYGTRH
jgi:regulator of CtrA degradation